MRCDTCTTPMTGPDDRGLYQCVQCPGATPLRRNLSFAALVAKVKDGSPGTLSDGRIISVENGWQYVHCAL